MSTVDKASSGCGAAFSGREPGPVGDLQTRSAEHDRLVALYGEVLLDVLRGPVFEELRPIGLVHNARLIDDWCRIFLGAACVSVA
jgi:hypothetical protein